jgi:hypothetical protein
MIEFCQFGDQDTSGVNYQRGMGQERRISIDVGLSRSLADDDLGYFGSHEKYVSISVLQK